MDYSEEIIYLRQALALAKLRQGSCAPNPSVGALIVREGRVIADGYHLGSGHPHAEVAALMSLQGTDVSGATLYVTLEPCCHWGKTPPCTSLILEYNIKRVVYAFADPNPLVNGKGAQLLASAGIICQQISLPEIDAFYNSYRFWRQWARPYVIAKLAMSLDSKIAAAGYKSVVITGDAARLFTHQQRRQADAILTTVRTINADNPQLNIRLPETAVQSKPLYVLDSKLSINPDATIFRTTASVTLFHLDSIAQQKVAPFKANGIKCVAVAKQAEGLDLNQVLDYIGKEGIHELWVEAGGCCFHSLLTQKLLQKAFIYIAPTFLGTSAITAFYTDTNSLAEAKKIAWKIFDKDIVAEITF